MDTVRKIAFVINGDTEARHLENVDRSVRELKRMGYTVYVASPEAPSTAPDRYVPATHTAIQALLADVATDANDDVVLYTTGHGDQQGKRGTLCLGHDCRTTDLLALFDGKAYGSRVVVMDQCFAGNEQSRFTDDPKTLFITAGGTGETVCCGLFAPKFWSDQVPDPGHDGVSWDDRYAFAVASGHERTSTPQRIPTLGYRSSDTPPFPATVQAIADGTALDAQLRRLRPGQYAFITFSATWCEPCKRYAPHFDALAAEGDGQVLFLRTENEDLARAFDVTGYPTVMLVTGQGQRYVVPNANRDELFTELAAFSVPVETRIRRLRARLDNTEAEWTEVADVYGTYSDLIAALPPRQRKAAHTTFHARFDEDVQQLGTLIRTDPWILEEDIQAYLTMWRNPHCGMSLSQRELAAFRTTISTATDEKQRQRLLSLWGGTDGGLVAMLPPARQQRLLRDLSGELLRAGQRVIAGARQSSAAPLLDTTDALPEIVAATLQSINISNAPEVPPCAEYTATIYLRLLRHATGKLRRDLLHTLPAVAVEVGPQTAQRLERIALTAIETSPSDQDVFAAAIATLSNVAWYQLADPRSSALLRTRALEIFHHPPIPGTTHLQWLFRHVTTSSDAGQRNAIADAWITAYQQCLVVPEQAEAVYVDLMRAMSWEDQLRQYERLVAATPGALGYAIPAALVIADVFTAETVDTSPLTTTSLTEQLGLALGETPTTAEEMRTRVARALEPLFDDAGSGLALDAVHTAITLAGTDQSVATRQRAMPAVLTSLEDPELHDRALATYSLLLQHLKPSECRAAQDALIASGQFFRPDTPLDLALFALPCDATPSVDPR
ncbi:MAG: hypothetical protein HY696_00305 [Deltaproteobacteria bacterium]|nr:hypothetical protein [Deltaproteobacteria bacterium]